MEAQVPALGCAHDPTDYVEDKVLLYSCCVHGHHSQNVPLSLTLRFDVVSDPVYISKSGALNQVTFPSVTMAIAVTGACLPSFQRKRFRGCIGLVMCNLTLSPFRFVTVFFVEITTTEMERNNKIKPSLLSE